MLILFLLAATIMSIVIFSNTWYAPSMIIISINMEVGMVKNVVGMPKMSIKLTRKKSNIIIKHVKIDDN